MKNLLNIKQVCELLNLKRPTIYKMTMNKTIPHFKIGGKILFDRDELEKWVNGYVIESVESINNRRNK